jgi:fucokinase
MRRIISNHTLASSSRLHPLLARAAETYKRALIGHQPGLTWDYLVLTAANEHQAAGYRHELRTRSEGSGPMGAFFPSSQQSIVVPDPPGFRAGSGGATLGVLRAIAAHQKSIGDKKPYDALRILLIHSGGASQRLPQFSPLGKIFTPLPLIRPDGQLMTLFDHLYLMMAALPARLGPGMLVAAGDVFLLFDATQMPAPPAGVTALTMRVPEEMGEAHGVFAVEGERVKGKGDKGGEKNAFASPPSPFPSVTGTMQKATVADMRAAGVTDSTGRVLIDSGLLFFDSAAATGLYKLAARYTSAWHLKTRRQIDLYSDIAPAAMATQSPAVSDDPVHRLLQADLRQALKHSPLRAYELSGAHFQHIGTTRQFRDAMVGLDRSPTAALFSRNVRYSSASPIPRTARVYQSVIRSPDVKLHDHVVIENCELPGRLTVRRGSILSNLRLPARSTLSARRPVVPPNTLVFGVPIEDRGNPLHITVILGVQDDCKTDRTFCNIDLRRWLKLAGLAETDLWSGRNAGQRTLWTARLFRGVTVESGPAQSHLPDMDWMTNPRSLSSLARKNWRKAPRYSLADILELAGAAAMAAHRDSISGTLQAVQWIDAVQSCTAASVTGAINHFGAAGYQQLADRLFAAAGDAQRSALDRARLAWNLGEIQSRPHFPREDVTLPATVQRLQALAFAGIAEAMTPPAIENQPARIEHAIPLTASAPVRLDLAGGWSDTPPYCLESGGAVVNLAVNLNDVEPICSTFRPLDEPIVRLVSRDLGKTLIVSAPDTLRRPIEPGDPFALQITALRLAGLAPLTSETSQRQWLSRISARNRGRQPAGFELTTASNLPKGSGMGTSSILGATTLAVLRAATGRPNTNAHLFEQTLLLEQHLGTGGGWQDQVGGIVGGAKITETRPGIPQVLKVRKIPLAPAQLQAFEDRLVVYFTGQQRLARNILREVMGRYLSREPGTMVLFNELKQSARACEAALRKTDWLSCATEINRYWRIKRELFPGSTTPAVDSLFLELRPFYLGAGLAGAGGGGFAYFLCSDPDQAHRLRTELRKLSTRPGSLGLAFAATINTRGIRISSGTSPR